MFLDINPPQMKHSLDDGQPLTISLYSPKTGKNQKRRSAQMKTLFNFQEVIRIIKNDFFVFWIKNDYLSFMMMQLMLT